MDTDYHRLLEDDNDIKLQPVREKTIPEKRLLKFIQFFYEQTYHLHVSVQMCFLDNLQLSHTQYSMESPSWELAGTKMDNPKISVNINPNKQTETTTSVQEEKSRLRKGRPSMERLQPGTVFNSQTLIMESMGVGDLTNKPCPYGIASVHTWYNLTFPTKEVTGFSFQQVLDVASISIDLSFAFIHKIQCIVGAKAFVDMTQDLRDWIQQDKEEQLLKLKHQVYIEEDDVILEKFHQTKEYSVPLEMENVSLRFPEIDQAYELLRPNLDPKILGHVILRVDLVNYSHSPRPRLPVFHDLCSLFSNHEYAKESALHLFKNFNHPTSDRHLKNDLINYFDKVEDPVVFEIISELSTRLSKNPLKKALANLTVAKKKENIAKKKNDYAIASNWAAEKVKCEDCIVRYLDLFIVLQGQKAKGDNVKANNLLDSLFKASLKFRASRVLAHPVIQKVLYDKWGKKVHLEKDRCNGCPFFETFFSPKGSFFLNVISYILFLVLLTLPFAMVSDQSYWFYNYVDQNLLEPPNSNTPGYRTIMEINDFWNWLIGQFGPGLFETPEREGYLKLVGTPIIRQFRVNYVPCDYPSDRTPKKCSPELDLNRLDWEQGGIFQNITPWTTNSGNPYMGFVVLTSVPSGGYTLKLSLNQTELISQLQSLQQANWIDTATRVVIIEVLVYSANTERLSFLELHIDFTAMGAIIPSVFYTTISEDDTKFSRFIWLRVLEIIYLFSLIGVKIRDFLTAPKSYFSDNWNLVDLPWILAMLIVIVMSFKVYVLNPYTMTNDELNNAWYFYFWREFIEGFLVSFGYFRLGYYTRMFKTTGILLSILKVIAYDVLLYLFLEFSLLLGFAFIFYSLYGNTDFQSYRTYGTVVMSLMYGVFGNYPFQSAYDQTGANSLCMSLGLFLEVCFLISGFIIVNNILIAMMSNSYDNIRQQALQRWSFDFSHLISKFQGTTWPPPFNVFGYIYHYLRAKRAKAIEIGYEKRKSTNTDLKQSKLVKKLISLYDQTVIRERQSGNSTVQSWRDDLNLETKEN